MWILYCFLKKQSSAGCGMKNHICAIQVMLCRFKLSINETLKKIRNYYRT